MLLFPVVVAVLRGDAVGRGGNIAFDGVAATLVGQQEDGYSLDGVEPDVATTGLAADDLSLRGVSTGDPPLFCIVDLPGIVVRAIQMCNPDGM